MAFSLLVALFPFFSQPAHAGKIEEALNGFFSQLCCPAVNPTKDELKCTPEGEAVSKFPELKKLIERIHPIQRHLRSERRTFRLPKDTLSGQKPSKIAIVDDSPIITLMISTMLQKELGISSEDIVVFPNGQAFVNHLEKNKEKNEEKNKERFDFDLIILDYDMPHMGGLDTLVAFREHEMKQSESYLPAIVIAASSEKNNNADLIFAKADRFVLKGDGTRAIRDILIEISRNQASTEVE